MLRILLHSAAVTQRMAAGVRYTLAVSNCSHGSATQAEGRGHVTAAHESRIVAIRRVVRGQGKKTLMIDVKDGNATVRHSGT